MNSKGYCAMIVFKADEIDCVSSFSVGGNIAWPISPETSSGRHLYPTHVAASTGLARNSKDVVFVGRTDRDLRRQDQIPLAESTSSSSYEPASRFGRRFINHCYAYSQAQSTTT